MGPGRPHAGDDLVAARQNVLGLHPQVGERRDVHPEEGHDPLLRRREAGQLLVVDEIVRKRVAERFDVAGVEKSYMRRIVSA